MLLLRSPLLTDSRWISIKFDVRHSFWQVMYTEGVWSHWGELIESRCRILHSKNSINSSPPGQNGRNFTDDMFKRIFVNENIWMLNKFSLKCALWGWIHNMSALVQIMVWRRPGDKPLSEPMLTQLTAALGGDELSNCLYALSNTLFTINTFVNTWVLTEYYTGDIMY